MELDTAQEKLMDQFMTDLKLDQLPPEKQEKALAEISARLQEIMMDTLIKNLEPEGLQKLNEALDDPNTMEDKITLLAAEVPGRDRLIEEAWQAEFEFLKYGMNKE
jgi:hypothetical protein